MRRTALAVVAVAFLLAGAPLAAHAETVAELLRRTHVHGLAVDPVERERLLVATHHGFHAAYPDGRVEQISDRSDDMMGFSPHPTDPDMLYASGHPAGGGNLGVIASTDGGRSWEQISPGVNGPVDFHQMAVSAADPSVMYGIYGVLQRSDDGGRNWSVVGPPPEGAIAIAASARDAERLYAATERGIVASLDGGQNWRLAHSAAAPATAIETANDGTLYAYMVGQGLLTAVEDELPQWRRAGPELAGDDVLLHIAVDPEEPERIYAASWRGRLLASQDGGATWGDFGAE